MYQGHVIATVTAYEFLMSAHCLMILYICTKFKKISQRVSELLSGHILKFTKGHKSIKM